MKPVAVEPEESPRAAKEDALVRKPAGSQGGRRIMHDLDEMIFGKNGEGTSDVNSFEFIKNIKSLEIAATVGSNLKGNNPHLHRSFQTSTSECKYRRYPAPPSTLN
ncbi:hypothetical protein QJS04_geneDACA008873 [Acorus gramineus]|uniref:Uncharacterized protein n=1 Tax=Acorus gramineus TaxID=55184 RepID=A0AAV9AF92_ACOGR|nr:hypothetical protein QJS04_geneDACA008873 [Acorus gramineus]